MFERYTERARRSIFFARYEASQFGSDHIEPEHFLLGILREDRSLRSILSHPVREQIRSTIEARQIKREKISTSLDLPLSNSTKRALTYAAEEADLLHHHEIECGHLVLGLLRLEPSVVGELLAPLGIGYESMKATVAAHPVEAAKEETEPSGPVHPLGLFVSEASRHLTFLRERDAGQHLKLGPWTRREAMGHLIDYATAHHQWISRAMVEPRMVGAGYPGEDRVAAQNYAQMPWSRLVRVWTALNELLGEVMLRVPEEKKQTPCKIGVTDEIPLATLMERYVSYTQSLVAQILTRDTGA
jgi:hypothetical protein